MTCLAPLASRVAVPADRDSCAVQIIAGWVLGSAFALVYAVRACNLQQYVLLHNVRPAHIGLDNH